MRPIVIIRASRAKRLEIQQWCDEILGKRGHWSTPMNTKPWYVRIGAGVDNYEFSFSTEAAATMFTLKWL